MNKKNLLLVLVMLVAALGIAGCGDDADNPTDDNPALSEQEDPQGEQTEKTESSDDSSGQKLSLVADPNGDLKYDTDKLNAIAGNLTIALTNESSVPHDVAVEDSTGSEIGKSDEITQSDTTLELKDVQAGSYTFYCTVPGHKAAGMEGTLTVR